MRLVVCPPRPGFNSADLRCADAVIFGNVLLHPGIGADRVDLLQGKLCVSAALSAIGSAVLNAVCLVSRCRVPTQVAQNAVLRVSVIVAPLLFVWSRTNKSGQNKGMNSHHFWLIELPKKNKGARIGLQNRGLFGLFGFDRPYPANVRNLIYSFVSYDRLPVFHTQQSGTFSLVGQA